MTASRPLRVTIVAHGDTVHHRRFARAIIARGHHVRVVRWDNLQNEDNHLCLLDTALAESDADVVLAGPVPTVAADVVQVTSCPVVVASWGSDLLVDARRDLGLRERAKVALLRATAILIDSRTVAHMAMELGAAKEKMVRFPWGVDLEIYRWEPLPPLGSRLKVVSLRSLEADYRVDVLIAAMATAPQVDLLVLGDGGAAMDLQRTAEAIGVADRITFRGLVDEQAIPEALRAAHVHVSTAPVDGTSVSLLQALATGRPSIVVDNASNREWIDHGVTGWVTPVGDADALAEALQAAHAAPGVLHTIAQRGRTVVERDADWTVHATTLCETLEKAVAGP